MSEIGFVLLTHNNSEQALGLIESLNKFFNSPPIVLHHDFSKTNFPTSKLSANVKVVQDYEVTSWGDFSLVSAKMKGLKLLYSGKSMPQYYVTLSGADYPTQSAAKTLATLRSKGADVFMRSTQIHPSVNDKSWKKAYYKRYCAPKILFRRNKRNGLNVVSQLSLSTFHVIDRFFTPFTSEITCWAGEFWYTGTKKSAEYLIKYFEEDYDGIVAHYKNTKIPDESIFQTIFKNAPNISVHDTNFRYIDWSEGLPHPKTLIRSDYEAIVSNNSHFARKLDVTASLSLYEELDALLEGESDDYAG